MASTCEKIETIEGRNPRRQRKGSGGRKIEKKEKGKGNEKEKERKGVKKVGIRWIEIEKEGDGGHFEREKSERRRWLRKAE